MLFPTVGLTTAFYSILQIDTYSPVCPALLNTGDGPKLMNVLCQLLSDALQMGWQHYLQGPINTVRDLAQYWLEIPIEFLLCSFFRPALPNSRNNLQPFYIIFIFICEGFFVPAQCPQGTA